MAKVMVSMPDELLARVDAEAERTGSTRSAVLRSFAAEAFERRNDDRVAERRALIAKLQPRVGNHGGDAAELVKATRPKWPK